MLIWPTNSPQTLHLGLSASRDMIAAFESMYQARASVAVNHGPKPGDSHQVALFERE
jgi:hypothetical protein